LVEIGLVVLEEKIFKLSGKSSREDMSPAYLFSFVYGIIECDTIQFSILMLHAKISESWPA
jgi:hypothetical protein